MQETLRKVQLLQVKFTIEFSVHLIYMSYPASLSVGEVEFAACMLIRLMLWLAPNRNTADFLPMFFLFPVFSHFLFVGTNSSYPSDGVFPT